MKQFLCVLFMITVLPAWADASPKETAKVCVDQKDKEGKPVTDAKGADTSLKKPIPKPTTLRSTFDIQTNPPLDLEIDS